MTENEAKKAFAQLKAQGHTDEEILGGLYVMFQKDKISFEELESYIDTLGYEMTDEFKAMSPEDRKTKGIKIEDEKADGVTKEEVEDAKEFDEEDEEEEKEDEKDDKKESDDEKAARLFGFEKKDK